MGKGRRRKEDRRKDIFSLYTPSFHLLFLPQERKDFQKLKKKFPKIMQNGWNFQFKESKNSIHLPKIRLLYLYSEDCFR